MGFIKWLKDKFTRKYKLELDEIDGQTVVFETPFTDQKQISEFAQRLSASRKSKYFVLPKGVKVKIIPNLGSEKSETWNRRFERKDVAGQILKEMDRLRKTVDKKHTLVSNQINTYHQEFLDFVSKKSDWKNIGKGEK